MADRSGEGGGVGVGRGWGQGKGKEEIKKKKGKEEKKGGGEVGGGGGGGGVVQKILFYRFQTSSRTYSDINDQSRAFDPRPVPYVLVCTQLELKPIRKKWAGGIEPTTEYILENILTFLNHHKVIGVERTLRSGLQEELEADCHWGRWGFLRCFVLNQWFLTRN